MFNRIQSKLFPSGAANGRLCEVGVRLLTLAVVSAQHDIIVIFAELGPADKVAISIVIDKLISSAASAELILLPQELVCAKDCKDGKDEDNEEEDAHQSWDRGKQRLNLQAHRGHLVDRTKRSQDTERSQSLQAVTTTADGQHANDADENDEEIEAVPSIAQVTILVANEAHSDDLDDALSNEDA